MFSFKNLSRICLNLLKSVLVVQEVVRTLVININGSISKKGLINCDIWFYYRFNKLIYGFNTIIKFGT